MTQDGGVAEYQLRALLDAHRTIMGDLDLAQVLHRILETALELARARHGTLAVAGEDGLLEEYVSLGDGLDTDGHLQPTTGRPSAISVPVRIGEEPIGSLRLTREAAEPFTASEEELLEAIAGTAGVAIANARVFEESRLRQAWLTASTEVTRRVLVGDTDALRLVAREVHRLARADLTTVVQPLESELLVAVGEGAEGKRIEGARYAASGTLSEHVLQRGKPIRIADAEDPTSLDGTIYLAGDVRVGPVMVLPLLGREEVRGTLVVMREPGRRPFTQGEAEMATTFANHASVALELAEARRDQQRVLLLEDRARIARDLHDHVIQQVFAAGLVIQATASGSDDPALIGALQDVVTNLDDAIKQIRVSIFQLQPPVPGSLRAAVLDVVADVRPGLGIDPRVDLDGPLDSVATNDLVSDVTAVVRESLVNIARHAAASEVQLSIHATTTRLTVTVSDDGVGVGDGRRRSGLENLRERAESRHGSMAVAEVPDLGGTTVVWTVPIV
ncbi:MAG: GAF domain-containing protein [Nocardioides sp.]